MSSEINQPLDREPTGNTENRPITDRRRLLPRNPSKSDLQVCEPTEYQGRKKRSGRISQPRQPDLSSEINQPLDTEQTGNTENRPPMFPTTTHSSKFHLIPPNSTCGCVQPSEHQGLKKRVGGIIRAIRADLVVVCCCGVVD